MVDRPPPSRFSVVERGGRLVVIDTETGQTPPTAAERMDLHDRKMGVEPIRPAARQAKPVAATIVEATPQRETPRPPNARMAAAVAEMNRKQPWNQKAKTTAQPNHRPAPAANSAPARGTSRPTPQTGGSRKTIVTGKWWDSKGPRTIELGPKGQQVLNSSIVTLLFVVAIAAIVALFVEPVVFFIGGFLLFRFGGSILGPVGAGIIDKALAEKG
ncbi:hypothetical protein [Sphingopyxis sp.]|uniref:hypothetical protein n=1 Tax=Sphingopyxis sp. TaxID=1908224 RepID=UPI002ED785EB